MKEKQKSSRKNTLTSFRKKLDKKRTELSLCKKRKAQYDEEVLKLNAEYNVLVEARDIFQKASILTQNHLASHLSTIVTKALRTVFYEKDISFLVEFVERRNTTECDMWFEENEKKFSLLESRGYGMVDIASFALRVAYILLHESANVLIIDEPFRNLHVGKHEIASEMVKQLSNELGIQFIIATHVAALKEYADESFHVIQKKGISISY